MPQAVTSGAFAAGAETTKTTKLKATSAKQILITMKTATITFYTSVRNSLRHRAFLRNSHRRSLQDAPFSPLGSSAPARREWSVFLAMSDKAFPAWFSARSLDRSLRVLHDRWSGDSDRGFLAPAPFHAC